MIYRLPTWHDDAESYRVALESDSRVIFVSGMWLLSPFGLFGETSFTGDVELGERVVNLSNLELDRSLIVFMFAVADRLQEILVAPLHELKGTFDCVCAESTGWHTIPFC